MIVGTRCSFTLLVERFKKFVAVYSKTFPSEISCKQDLGQDTRYRNVSRS